MHIAARNGHFLIVKYLVELGADSVMGNKEGHTPYDFANDSKRQLEMQRASSKNKIGGPGFDPAKLQGTLENLDSILRLIVKSHDDRHN